MRSSQINRLRIVVLLALAMLIPLGSVYADGSKGDATAKIIAIKKATVSAAAEGTDSAAGKKTLVAIKKKLALRKKLFAAVKAGKLIAEQAKAKCVAITKGKGGK